MAQLTSNTAALIQETVQSLIVGPLVQQSTFLQQGPKIFDTAAPIRIPRIAATSASFVAEGATIPTTSASFDEIDMMASTFESLKSMIVVSRELIRSAVLGVTTVLENRLVQDLGIALDAAFWNGTGTVGTNIVGLANQAGITSQTYSATTGAGSLQDQDTYLTALKTSAENFVNPTCWVFNPSDYYGVALQAKDTLGRLLFVADPTGQAPSRLFGLPVVITTHVPAGTTLLVDFSLVAVARDTSPAVDVLFETFAATDEIGIRSITRFDLALLHPPAVTALTYSAS